MMTGLQAVLTHILSGFLAIVGIIAEAIGSLALAQTQLPWVQGLQTDLMAVVWTLLGLRVGYEALTRYILWNEGTADLDGTALWKGILRMILYVGIAGTLATTVFRWGLDLSNLVLGAPMTGAVTVLHKFAADLATLPSAVLGFILALALALIGSVVALLIILVQMAIRSAELIYYILAGPFLALGQINLDGGTWTAWWQGLVVLALAQAWQVLALKGMIGTTQFLMSQSATGVVGQALAHGGLTTLLAGLPLSDGRMVVMLVLSLLLMVGWLVVGIRGPHILQQWAYRSGLGSGMISVGGLAVRPIGEHTQRSWGGWLTGTRFGGWLGMNSGGGG
ncbi:MAG: hypothetical protein OWV35_09480 [Firmicutes bacterium]|nr:hypothetical protein [Bacillota bacterium]